MKQWIQGLKKGALHQQMGVPVDQTIPQAALRRAAKSKNKLLAKRARTAITLEKL